MVWYEERYSRIRIKVFCVSTGEDGTSETSRNASIFASPGMEVGTCHYGLRCQFAPYSNRPRCHLVECRLTHEIGTLFGHA